MNIGSVLVTATNGMLKNARSVHESADRIVRQPVSGTSDAPDETNMIREIVNMRLAEIGYSANAHVIRTTDDMSATLLRILA
ncbi:MAG: hypothetical protein HQ501_09910 [Rhodospirillales bacterium]|nr:hypothetical protein [Rhodospirillales bacterium]